MIEDEVVYELRQFLEVKMIYCLCHRNGLHSGASTYDIVAWLGAWTESSRSALRVAWNRGGRVPSVQRLHKTNYNCACILLGGADLPVVQP
jgi:hypothetical protein